MPKTHEGRDYETFLATLAPATQNQYRSNVKQFDSWLRKKAASTKQLPGAVGTPVIPSAELLLEYVAFKRKQPNF